MKIKEYHCLLLLPFKFKTKLSKKVLDKNIREFEKSGMGRTIFLKETKNEK